MKSMVLLVFFFFQAEDGIRDYKVTGVQTCALPICITRIIVNITSNTAIRFLLICGKDSALFKPGQSLVALAERGIDDKRRIIDAAGYDPVFPLIDPEQVKQFRENVEILDWSGEEELQSLQERVK